MHTQAAIPADVLELLRLTDGPALWDAIHDEIPPWHPRNEETPEEKAAREQAEAEAAAAAAAEGDEKVTLTKAEHDDLQRRLRESTTTASQLKKEKEERERKEAEDKGEHEKIAAAEKRRADEAEAEARQLRNETRVERVASRLKFRDPTDVIGRLSDDDLSDESSIEKKLKAIAKEKPYLVTDGEATRQRDVSGGDGGGANEEAPVAGTSRMARAYAAKG